MNSLDSLNAITRRALRVNYQSPPVCLPDAEESSGSGSGNASTLDINPIYRANGPIELSATLVAGPEILLSWSEVEGAYAYIVYTSSSAEGPWTVLAAGVVGTTYTHEDLTTGVHYYKVTAIEPNAGETYPSPIADEEVPLPPERQPGPSELLSSQNPAPAIELDWTPVPGATEYKIYTADNPLGPFNLWPFPVDGSQTDFVLEDGITSGEYYVYVTAIEPIFGETYPSPTIHETIP